MMEQKQQFSVEWFVGLSIYLIESGVIPLTYAYQKKYLEFKELKSL